MQVEYVKAGDRQQNAPEADDGCADAERARAEG